MIDEGKKKSYKFNQGLILTDLPENYSEFQPNAKHCTLKKNTDEKKKSTKKNQQKKINWSKETIDFFKQIIENYKKKFYINSVSKNTEQVKNMVDELEDVYTVDIYYL